MTRFVSRLGLGVLAFTVAAAVPAQADIIAVNDLVKVVDGGHARYTYFDGVKNYVGGAFDLDNQGAGSDFVTFCIERNESVKVGGGDYRVANLSGSASNGGFGGGNPDPLDDRTKYLYFNYRKGLTGGWVAGWTTADLQRAIWHIEDELAGFAPAGIAEDLMDYAALHAPGFDYAGEQVRVVTLETLDGGKAQDLLAITPVPEPATVLLLGAGLLGLVKLRRRG